MLTKMTQTSNQTPLAILPDVFSIPPIAVVKRQSSYGYYGPVDVHFLVSAVQYLTSHSDASEDLTSQFLESFIQATQTDCVGKGDGKAACWLCIRLFHPSEDYRIPRWHQDGRMYTYDEGRESVVRSKYGITLLGPQTLMLPASTHIFDTIANSRRFFSWRGTEQTLTREEITQAGDEQRQYLAEQYKNEKRIELRKNQVVRFSWGRDDSPVHSEPDFVCDRVFITVLYGSVPEMHRMCELRGEEYGISDVYYPHS